MSIWFRIGIFRVAAMNDNDWGPVTDAAAVRRIVDARLVELGLVPEHALREWRAARQAEAQRRMEAIRQQMLYRPHGGPVE